MRIASLSPAATEILFGLEIGVGLGIGKGSKTTHEIVCVDQFSDVPEEAKRIPHLRGMVKIRPEDVRAHRPDIAVLGTSVQAKLAEMLRADGFTVVFDDPRTLAQIASWIRSLGVIVDRGREAEAMQLRMRQEFNALRRKAALLPRRPKIYIEEWHDPPYASGNWVPEIVRIAGGEQILARSGELSRTVTLDDVAAAAPELIVISWCGAGALADRELLLRRPGWDRLEAVRAGRVRVIDDSLLNRPGPRLVDGARRLYGWMFEMVH